MSEVTETLVMEQTSTGDNGGHTADPLYSWSQLGVSCPYDELSASFTEILTQIESSLEEEIRNLAQKKKCAIMESAQGAVQRALLKVVEHLSVVPDTRTSSIFDELQMSQDELRKLLPVVTQQSRMLSQVASNLGCAVNEVSEVVNSKCDAIAELRSKLTELREKSAEDIRKKDSKVEDLVNQVKQLQEQVRRLPGAPESGSLVNERLAPTPQGGTNDGGDNWCAVRNHLVSLKGNVQRSGELHDTNAGLQPTRTAPSVALSRASSQTSLLESTISESTSTPTYGTGNAPCPTDGVGDMFTIFREVFKAQSVADVVKYNGKSSLTEFLRALEVKFPSSVWRESDRRDILVNHLDGTALSIFKGLPPKVREGTFNGVVDALRMARKNPCERLKNVRNWEQLSKRSGEATADFCCRIEELSRRLHPSNEWDFLRGSKLYSCLEHWENSYHMLAALDAPEGQIYEEVKRVATRLEKLQADGPRMFSSQRDYTRGGHIDRKTVTPTRNSALPSPSGPAGSRSPVKCYSCGKAGHVALNCKNSKRPLQRHDPEEGGSGTGTNRGKRSGVGGISLSADLDGWCKTVQRKRKRGAEQSQAVGKPCTVDVKIFGVLTKALVDTGSVVSIIPVGLLKRARDGGADLDTEARVVGNAKQRKLFDASGNRMSFLSEIVTEVRVQKAGTAAVRLQVQQSKDNTLLLGTNALHQLGITLNLSPKLDDSPVMEVTIGGKRGRKVLLPLKQLQTPPLHQTPPILVPRCHPRTRQDISTGSALVKSNSTAPPVVLCQRPDQQSPYDVSTSERKAVAQWKRSIL